LARFKTTFVTNEQQANQKILMEKQV